MDTYMTITVAGAQSPAALAEAEAQIHALEALLSATREESAVSRLNRQGTLEDGEELGALLLRAEEISRATQGAFDVTVRPLLTAWGFTGAEYRVPAAQELEERLALVNWQGVSVQDGRIALRPGQEIDLGGIAKGYASACVAQGLRERGIESALLYLGGSVQLLGTKPDGQLWRVGIEDPHGGAENLGVIEAADTAIVTSGAYQRFFEQDGQRYHHILDPQSGYPARSDLASVTVVCSDAVLADGYSTALFVLGAERAAEFWRERGGEFEMVLCTASGELFITPGLEAAFSSSRPYEVLTP